MAESSLNQTDQSRQEQLKNLTELVEFLSAHPRAKAPWVIYIYHPCETAEQMVERVREFGGKWEKAESDLGEEFELRRKFGGYEYILYTSRKNVCTPKPVALKTVVRRSPKDSERARQLEAKREEAEIELDMLETEYKTVYEEQIEWECPESLLELVNKIDKPAESEDES
jgi:hypothetical protein